MDGTTSRVRPLFRWVLATERLTWAVKVRWAVIGGFLGLGGALHPFADASEVEVLIWAAALGSAVNLVNQISLDLRRGVLPVTACAVALDNLLITWVCSRTGGIHSPFLVMYSVQVVATAMLVSASAAIASAALAIIGLTALIGLEDGAGAQGLRLRNAQWTAQGHEAAWAALIAYGLALLVFVGGFVSRRLRRSEEALRQRNQDLSNACERLQQAEAQMIHTEKMRALGHLVAGVAHELNNPISFVSANVEHLRRAFTHLRARALCAEGPHDEQLQALLGDLPGILDDCQDGTRRVKRIVSELREFARGANPDDWGEFDLNACVRATIRILRHRFGKGIAIDLLLEARAPVWGSAGQIEQVVLNLVVNAIDAVGEHGHIRVTTRDHRESVVLEVSDDGPGIAAIHLPKVFEPFFTTKPVGEGTGIGLSLSYAIARRHGGTLDARSIAGEGATFELRLPVARPPRVNRAPI